MTVEQLRRELARAEHDSARLSERRATLPPGSSRAVITSINAKWARLAEYRDTIRARLEAMEAKSG